MAMRAEDAWRALDLEAPPEVVWLREVAGRRVVVLLGAFDPPTLAHVALAKAAAQAESAPAVFGLTKVLLDRGAEELLPPLRRLVLLEELAARLGFGVLAANCGRYVEVDEALRRAGRDPVFVVGSDKLAQIADPRLYPDGERGVERTFERVRFLVVSRGGIEVRRGGLRELDPTRVFLDPRHAELSASEVRRRLNRGEPVDDLVPPEVARQLAGYTATR